MPFYKRLFKSSTQKVVILLVWELIKAVVVEAIIFHTLVSSIRFRLREALQQSQRVLIISISQPRDRISSSIRYNR